MLKQTQQQTQQNEEVSHQVAATVPWWRHPLPGYGFAIVIVAIFTGITLIGENILQYYYFPNSASLLMGILCVALLWGVGPGLLATILSCIALIYIYLFPVDKIGAVPPPFDWEVVFPVVLFAIAGLAVVILIGQRESARRKAVQAEQVAQTHATDLANVNQELRQANQFKDLFVSITSHELKTPITTIRGQAQLALRRLKKHAAASPELDGLKEAFVKVDEQTSRLTKLLNELLDLTSLRSGKQVLAKQTCNLNEICSKAIEEQRMVSERAIELKLPEEPILLQGDAARLGQVVTNLVNNALKYSPSESLVRVKVERYDNQACFSVQDEGQGISPEHQENIFEPYYRTSDARASTISGSGLGLAICKDIVERHQGRIWCESRVGVGSTFFVELPL
ncbi:MAG TPA: ATP-binding protein [Ktedonobacteraceae bacterium]|nr:ATP-binding protein [Ktedonobacteraceae bacterium]